MVEALLMKLEPPTKAPTLPVITVNPAERQTLLAHTVKNKLTGRCTHTWP